ncbi:MAG: FAD:protein FMN transferase [Tepidiformaceae bacterium]
MLHEENFRAMDTEIDVLIQSRETARPIALFASVRVLFEQQEERFSRFRPQSLLSHLNGGEAVDDAWLAAASRMALEAHRFSGGLFNPLILGSLERAGYSRTFAEVKSVGEPLPLPAPDPGDCLKITGTVVRLRDARMDLGGIVKGWTVDLAVEMLSVPEPNVLVNAGGDLRCAGAEDGLGTGWVASIAALAGRDDAWVGRLSGALATSTTLKRRWRTAAGASAHHLIDPRTGMPAEEHFVQASAWQLEAWRAEVWAKAIVIGGDEAAQDASAAGVRFLALKRPDARP